MSHVNKGGFWYENTGGNESVHWLTPKELVDRLGHFDLDPCGCLGMPWRLADKVYYASKELIAAEIRIMAAKKSKDKERLDRAKKDYKEALAGTKHGLNQPWAGRVFCNPPYGNYITDWVKRMSEHKNGILLIFSRVETEVWQEYVWPHASAVLFPYGRIAFLTSKGVRTQSGNAPSALVAFGENNVEALRRCNISGYLARGFEALGGDKASSL